MIINRDHSFSQYARLQERLRRESLEREKQLEQDRLNSKLNEKKRQEVCTLFVCDVSVTDHIISHVSMTTSINFFIVTIIIIFCLLLLSSRCLK